VKKVFIFCESDPNKEPRVIRTIEALTSKYEITVCGYLPYKNFSFFDLGKFIERKKLVTFHLKYPALIRKPISAFLNLTYYKKSENILNPFLNIQKATGALNSLSPNVIICHGLGFLQLCTHLKTSEKKLVLNAHEYYPAEFEDKPEWKELGEKYTHVLSKCSAKIDLLFAVNETIGARYKKEFNIPFVEITNATDHEADLRPAPVTEPVRIVHHGVALVNRKIEIMIEAVLKSTIACELHLILVPTEREYFEKLISKYSSNKRIIFSDTVAVKQISKHLNQFDLGLFYLEPVNYNWKHALPNKLFEFVQARLAVMISPNPDMKKIVEQYELGWVTKDFSIGSLVDSINSVSVKKIEYYKNNSQRYSKELSSIKTKQMMLESVEQLCAA
jgi:hypothetical protein